MTGPGDGTAMRDIRVGAAQFEHRDGDKLANLERIASLTARAVAQGAEIVSFHECSITGYTFLRRLGPEAFAQLAEPVPEGPSVRRLIEIAGDHRTVVMAGLIEKRPDGRLYKAYVTVGPEGYLTHFRKLHPFIHPSLHPGDRYLVHEIRGVRAGFLVCYDLNLPENARITALMGAEVIFAPHVTGGTPSREPGRGMIDRGLWENRERDPGALRSEFEGMKGRAWLLRWLPARAWENGVYIVFSNAVGVDDDTIKPGGAMVVDPYGAVQAESESLGDEVVVTQLSAEKVERAPGRRYRRARRPELYVPLTAPHAGGEGPVTDPGWRVPPEQ
jgi:predicted amidohydrolase